MRARRWHGAPLPVPTYKSFSSAADGWMQDDGDSEVAGRAAMQMLRIALRRLAPSHRKAAADGILKHMRSSISAFYKG